MPKDRNAVTPVRLEPAAPWSRVKHSTTEHCAPYIGKHSGIFLSYPLIYYYSTHIYNDDMCRAFYLVCGFTSKLAAMVISRWSVNINTLSWGSLD